MSIKQFIFLTNLIEKKIFFKIDYYLFINVYIYKYINLIKIN